MIARALLAVLTLTLGFVAADSAAQRAPVRSVLQGDVRMAELPPEARETLELIRKGGPFPYAKDGAIFGNREGALPREKRGYYREYTVKTPHVRNRGGRRIIWGAGGEYYYTADHYTTFRRIRE
ncbi:MAG TPA: ribonuclease domain-containing protein [Usitatibacter sp.]|jgi:ribonuclease T1|nr:ribonuclease domain-containing protein [Usitatibacter sp.]